MDKTFVPMQGAEGWQLSNAPVLSMAAHYASLKVFEEAGFKNLLEKSKNLTDYLVFLIKELHESGKINIITPLESPERGCQISLLLKNNGKQVYDGLFKEGVIVDWREPNVIRLAPVPLYNNFVDVFGFAKILRNLLT
jgi:kynureninase